MGQSESPSARGAELTVYLMTMGPGDFVWERFGHNAIWIRDNFLGTHVAYNYGMFSFEQENFILRFIRGENDYWMEGFDAQLMANAYIQADRSVWAQELNLTPEQRADLRDFLEWNALPENRTYRYDYYRDNCSTRVRDAIDRVLGGRLRSQTVNTGSGSTFREHTRALTVADPPIYAGLMLGLGPYVDREISLWEEMFLPMQLMEHARTISVDNGNGELVPLVAAEYEIYRADRLMDASVPPSRAPWIALAGIVFGTVLIGAGRWAPGSSAARMVFGVMAGGWATIAGVLGLVLLGLWGFTAHTAAYRNENLLFVTPLLLPLAVLLPRLARLRGRFLRVALVLSIVVAGGSVLGLLLQVLPAFSQVNGEVIAFALPVNVALAVAVWRLARSSPGIDPAGRGRNSADRDAIAAAG
jgi:hypothetical protein